ncbi:hypothetical protein MLD38_030851 [Melastoma candidum]|uniref:Uncharacterized protein n=1 Tax=Melastoma candidum TaxID=119954 RepID=A0ACB9MP46_9MYRT|nr:hypothetical protein MLD38_030851 [Melastoma candidum]
MAQGRTRGSKRASSASYTSTVTTIVFVVLCVLGVWMLSSNSVSTPQATKRTSSKPAAVAVNVNSKEEEDPSSSTEAHTSRSNDRKDGSMFEDNPGELPDDAIKTDYASDKNPLDVQGGENAEGGSDDKQEGNGGNDGANSDDGGSNGEESGQGLQGTESAEENEKKSSNEEEASEESAGTHDQQKDENQQNVSEDQGNEQKQENNSEETSTNQDQETNDSRDQSNMAESSESTGDQHEEQKQESQDDGLGDSSQDTQTEAERQRSEETQQEQSQEDSRSNNEGENASSSDQASKEDQTSQQENEPQEDPQHAMSEEDQQKRIQEQQQQREEDQQKQLPITEATSADQDAHDEAEVQEMHDDTSQNDNSKEVTTEDTSGDGNNNNEQPYPGSGKSGIPQESKESKNAWTTQASQSENQNERSGSDVGENLYGYSWLLCNVTAGADYIPCLDNEKALRHIHTKHYEHRERHCPEEGPTCLVPTPPGYKKSIEWPKSRDKIWYHNVPHTKLAEVKGHQNWVKVTGEFLTFPGGGTQFIHGALHYIDFLQKSNPNIKWGKHTRVILDVGCGVASFGGYLFERDVLTMSFAPKDEHEAQVQFALERGIPAISAVMGSQRLPFPSRVFDLIHCARCRVPWHAEGGRLLLELNRILRPGGLFVWSATPVYQKLKEDVEIWKEMTVLTANMCWEVITIQRDKLNGVGAVIYRKPMKNDCYKQRKHQNPPMCKEDDDPNAAWYVPLQSCMHRLPVNEHERGTQWPVVWPRRMRLPPYWLNNSQMGIYGKPAPQDFTADYDYWKRTVSTSYMSGLGISWTSVRNVMDMRAAYGGFAAALKDLQMWVMNVVNIDSPDTLPIIYERGLFGIYHDWCESFSTYPRTYDLLHADHLFSKLKKRCKLAPVMAEVDRIVRPGGKIIVRDESGTMGEVENLLKSLRWEVRLTFSKDKEGILSAQKGEWRPTDYADAP